jgi:hypothetical protein
MPPRGPEAAIAKFLRDALAGNEVGVPKLEAMARGAGLLGENQRITNAKPFKAASGPTRLECDSERVFYRRNVDVAKITLPWRKRD